MDNEERNYDNGGWQDPNQTGGFGSASGSSQTPNGGNYSAQSQNDNSYYSQPQNGNDYYNQPQNSYSSQSGDGFRQSNDGFNSVNNQGYQNYVPEPEEGPGYAIAGMVCGILSMVICCCQYYVSGVLAIIGMVFSIIVLKNGKPGKGMAIAGVVCSAIGIIIALFLIGTRIYMMSHPEYVNQILDIYRQNGLMN